MSDHEYHFNVAMTCSGAVERALKRVDGIKSVDISLEDQSVKVKTIADLSYDNVLATIKKTGKAVREGTVVH